MSRDTLRGLVEIVEAIREARREIERGELFSHEDVWA